MPRPGEESSPRTMRCLEVWGGNEAVDQGVVMPGLDGLAGRPTTFRSCKLRLAAGLGPGIGQLQSFG